MGFDLKQKTKDILEDTIDLPDGTVLRRRIKNKALEAKYREHSIRFEQLAAAEVEALSKDDDAAVVERVKAGDAVRASQHEAIAMLLTTEDGKDVPPTLIADQVDSQLLMPLKRYLEGREADPSLAPSES